LTTDDTQCNAQKTEHPVNSSAQNVQSNE